MCCLFTITDISKFLLAASQECPEFDQADNTNRPIYVKEVAAKRGEDAQGEGALGECVGVGVARDGTCIFCFFGEVKGRKGWYLGTREGGVLTRPTSKKGIVGFSPSKEVLPPKGGWQVKEGKQLIGDSAYIECVLI